MSLQQQKPLIVLRDRMLVLPVGRLQQTVYNISLEKLELSKVTILGVDSYCNLRFIQTASEQRLAIAPSSGRSHPQPPLTPSEWVPVLQLRLSPMAVMLLLLVPSSLFQT